MVGFDDITAAQHCDPPLTTMRQNPELLRRIAVERLAELIEGRPSAQLVTRTLRAVDRFASWYIAWIQQAQQNTRAAAQTGRTASNPMLS